MTTLKKIKSKLSATLLIVTMLLSSNLTFASEAKMNSGETAKSEKAHAEELISRIHEIASLNKKEMNSDEKSQLKKEVTSIKKELKELGGGVYISATLLVIILILIILL